MLSDKDINGFFNAVDSLKRFKRAEVKDNKDKPLIESLFTYLLPINQVLRLC